jgi:bifunctional non-homologous end joining protein LigD
MVRKLGDRVKIFTRRGADWTHRFPRIVEAAGRLKAETALLDGEGVVCGEDGVADFARLHSRACDHLVTHYAFDPLEFGGQDLRRQPLVDRKTALRKLLARRKHGIVYNEHIEDDGHLVFQHACHMGLEGIVAKRMDAPYRSGRSKAWIKIKNPGSPAMLRVEDGTF